MLELLVPTTKYEASISMLETQLGILKGLAAEYSYLQGQVNSFTKSGEIRDMARVVEQGAARVDKAIVAVQANIDTLKENVSNLENVGSNVTSIIQDAVNIVSTFS